MPEAIMPSQKSMTGLTRFDPSKWQERDSWKRHARDRNLSRCEMDVGGNFVSTVTDSNTSTDAF